MVQITSLVSACAVALAFLTPTPASASVSAPDSSIQPRFVFEKKQASAAFHRRQHHNNTKEADNSTDSTSTSSTDAGHSKHHHADDAASTTSKSRKDKDAPAPTSGSGAGSGTGTGAGAGQPSTPTAAPSLGSIPPSIAAVLSTLTPGTGNPTATMTVSTYTPGAQNTYIPSAPPLPDISQLDPSRYPDLDVLPSKSTRAAVVAQNKKWLAGVDFSSVPSIAASKDGSCASSPQLAAQAEQNGWWTCGLYTRSSDIVTCPQTNQFGLSYDDGPSPYTPQLLHYLDSTKLKATFFVVGSRAISRPEMIQAELMDGHQLSVHTWSHPALTTLSNEDIYLELRWTMEVLQDITGLTPNTMRPPYGDIDDRVRAVCKLLGLTPVIWSNTAEGPMDTQDWEIPSGGVTAVQAYVNFEKIFQQAPTLDSGYIVLEHDLYEQTVDLATKVVLPQALALSPKQYLMPVVQCLNKPLGDAYVQTNRNISGLGPAVTASGAQAVYPSGATPGSGAAKGADSSTGGAGRVVGVGGAASLGVVLMAAVLGGALLLVGA
ncbi:hypothetical protein V8E36_004132 [Tilletia maclaganii]